MVREKEDDDIETRLANRVEEALAHAEFMQHELDGARRRIAQLEAELAIAVAKSSSDEA